MSKKIILLILLLPVFAIAQVVNIPDANFKAALVADVSINTNGDGEIQVAEAILVDSLNVGSLGISDLTGIEAFTALTYLDCKYNYPLSSLDVSSNTALTRLHCDVCSLTSLDVSNNTALTYLQCENNSITSLNVSNNTVLEYLQCNDNSLTSLDVSGITTLKQLRCNINSLTTLDVSNNIALTYLKCDDNSLTSLDVSNNTALEYLLCGFNSITSLDVSNNLVLTDILCSGNSLTSLDVSKNTALTYLSCSDNSLVHMDVSNNTALTVLYCYNNALFSLDVRNGNNTNMVTFSAKGNPILSCISVDDSLWAKLNWTIYKDATANFYNNCDLLAPEVYIPDANFRSALIANAAINTNLDNRIQVTEANAYAGGIFVNSNGISNLTGLEAFTALTELSCANNSLTSIDVSLNTALISLSCGSNYSLTSLEVRNGNNAIMTSFSATNNPNLYCILVDDPLYSVTNWTEKDDLVQFTTSPCNSIVSGIAFHDANSNCLQDSLEKGLSNAVVKASGLADSYTTTNDTGYYELRLDSNAVYQIDVISFTSNDLFDDSCPNGGIAVNTGSGGTITPNVDFGLDLKLCGLLSVDVSTSGLRRCFRNSISITYRNEGPADMLNAEVFVDFPEYVRMVSANKSYTLVDASNDIYKFNISTVQAFSKGSISITDSVICGNEEIRGYTQCIKAWITPISHCAETKDTTAWDKSSIVVSDLPICINDSVVRFTITNGGDGDMASSHDYRIYYDNELAYTGSFQLESGESVAIDATADGSTIRLEADQHPLHPGNSRPRTTSEGCGSLSPETASLGFWTKSINDDLDFDVSVRCPSIIDSFDPNDKKVSPAGITENNYVSEDGPLNYTIRFQNTGTAEAYKIIVADTLSDQLDLATLSIGGASHEFTYQVMGTDSPVLVFTFNNINLPDSTTDEPGSHGFVSFTISPDSNIVPGTPIENFADIYFDYNSAIRTDTAAVIALDTILISSKIITVTELDVTGISENELLDMIIFPNPASDYITIQGADESFDHVRIYDATGRVVINKPISANQSQIDVSNLNTGVYFIHVLNDDGQRYAFKMVKE